MITIKKICCIIYFEFAPVFSQHQMKAVKSNLSYKLHEKSPAANIFVVWKWKSIEINGTFCSCTGRLHCLLSVYPSSFITQMSISWPFVCVCLASRHIFLPFGLVCKFREKLTTKLSWQMKCLQFITEENKENKMNRMNDDGAW